MSAIDWWVDGTVVVTSVVLALFVLCERDLFKSVVAFIVLGLFMALAWVRLQAPDVALAEAAVGAGITGVLLLDAARQMQQRGGREE